MSSSSSFSWPLVGEIKFPNLVLCRVTNSLSSSVAWKVHQSPARLNQLTDGMSRFQVKTAIKMSCCVNDSVTFKLNLLLIHASDWFGIHFISAVDLGALKFKAVHCANINWWL